MSSRFMRQEVDPRTQLPLVDVPSNLMPTFESLRGTIMHWVGIVRKVNSTHRESQRVAVVSDASLYLLDQSGNIKRCVLYKDLQDVLIRDKDDAIGFRVDQGQHDKDYDLLIRFGDEEQANKVLSYIKRIYWVHMGREIEVVQLAAIEAIDPHLMLTKPPGFTLRVEPLRSKKYVEKLLRDQESIDQRNDERVATEFVRLKAELKKELETHRNAQYDRMVKQNLKLINDVQVKDVELAELRRQLNRLEPMGSSAWGNQGGWREGSLYADRMESASKMQAAGGAGAGVGGNMDGVDMSAHKENMELIAELKKIIEQHPNTDKKRVLVAEEKLISTTKLLEQMQRDTAPQRDEIQLLRKIISAIDGVLRDQSISHQERIRAGLELSGPYAAPGDTATGRIEGPVSTDTPTLSTEVQWLRGLLRDVHALHDTELQAVRKEFDAYDEHMLDVVRAALDSYTPEIGIPNAKAAKHLVDGAKNSFQAGGSSYSYPTTQPARQRTKQQSPLRRRSQSPRGKQSAMKQQKQQYFSSQSDLELQGVSKNDMQRLVSQTGQYGQSQSAANNQQSSGSMYRNRSRSPVRGSGGVSAQNQIDDILNAPSASASMYGSQNTSSQHFMARGGGVPGTPTGSRSLLNSRQSSFYATPNANNTGHQQSYHSQQQSGNTSVVNVRW